MRIPDKRLIIGAVAVLAVLGGYWAFRPGPDDTPAAPAATAHPGALNETQIRRLGIRLEPARADGALPLGTVPAVITLPPEARVAVTSPFAGTAVQVLVIQGQQVRRGQALAVVRAAETVQFGAELARAQADLAFARTNAARLDQLAREGIVAGVRADEAKAVLGRTEATIRENRRLLSIAGAGGDGTVTLRAPIDGRVATAAIETGSTVGGGGTAPFVIENVSALALDLQLPERLAMRVRPGMTVEIASPAATGRVLSVAPSLDPATRSVVGRASIAPMAGEVAREVSGLVPGKGVMAMIRDDVGNGAGNGAGNGRPGVSVPTSAITRIDGQDYAFVRKGGRFERRKVTVVADAGGRAFLSAGLAAGEPVAISGVAELKSLLAGE